MRYHLYVWRAKPGAQYARMWKGLCTCGFKQQYWAWGATLGAMLHHYWKEHS